MAPSGEEVVYLKKADSSRKPLLSATIICKNEVEKIRGALDSVRFCDEVVVVDSGSDDGTLEICREAADVVIQKGWPGHIEQKNFALDAASGEWILPLDSDERVSPELAAEIEKTIKSKPEEDGFFINRRVHYLGKWIDRSGWYPEPRIRLFKKGRGRWGGVNPHDAVQVSGRVGRLKGDIIHFTYDDMEDHVNTLNKFSSILASEHKSRGRKFSWATLLLRPPLEFMKKFVLKRGFMDGPQGFYIASFSAFYVFLKIAKLWEAEKVGDDRPWKDSGR